MKRITLLFIVSLYMISCASTKNRLLHDGIEIKLENFNGVYFTSIQSDDSVLQTAWDTGATINLISSNYLLDSGMPKEIASNRKAPINFRVPISKTHISFSAFPYDFTKLNEFIDIDCIMGFPFFNSVVTEFDFTNNNLIIYSNSKTDVFSNRKGYFFTFEIQNYRPVIECFINDEKYKILIDTGSSGGIAIVSGVKIESIDNVYYEGTTGTGFFEGLNDTSYAKVKKISVFNEEYENLYLLNGIGRNTTISNTGELSTPTDFQMTLGTDFFQGSILILDYQRKTGYFERKKGTFTGLYPMPYIVDFDVVIRAVNKNIENNPFQIGDKIITVNDNSVTYETIKGQYGKTVGNIYQVLRENNSTIIKF